MKDDIDFLSKLMQLKDEKRAWIDIFDVDNGESVADHSWSVSLLVLYFGGEMDVDTEKCLKMAVVHDLAEAETGDIANRAKDEDREVSEKEKQEIERQVWEKFDEKGGDFINYWEEYKEKETLEAKFVKDMDLIDLCLQALKYEEEDRYSREAATQEGFEKLDEVFENSEKRLQTDYGRELFNNIREMYRKEKS